MDNRIDQRFVHHTILCVAIWLVGKRYVLFFIHHIAAFMGDTKIVPGTKHGRLSPAKYRNKIHNAGRNIIHAVL